MLIDTHTHIYCEEFDADRQAVIQRAIDAGVATMLLPAIDEATTERQESLAAAHPGLFYQMTGLHPTSVDKEYETPLAIVQKRLSDNPDKYVAIGEIGLDLYWDKSHKHEQLQALERQIELAKQYSKPIALHIRNAYDDVFELFKQLNYTSYTGVMHCFSGTMQQARRAIELGFYIGIGGTVTYKKSELPEIVKAIGLGHIVLETDAPYLAPIPQRGKRNEPSFLQHTATFIANMLNLPLQQVAEQTTANAKQLFNLP